MARPAFYCACALGLIVSAASQHAVAEGTFGLFSGKPAGIFAGTSEATSTTASSPAAAPAAAVPASAPTPSPTAVATAASSNQSTATWSPFSAYYSTSPTASAAAEELAASTAGTFQLVAQESRQAPTPAGSAPANSAPAVRSPAQSYMQHVDDICASCAEKIRDVCNPDGCDCHCQKDPEWYVEADAMYVTRNNGTRNQTVVLQDSTGDTVLTTHSLDFGWDSWGPRIFVGKQATCDSGWELGYFGLFGGSTSRHAEDPNNLDIPQPLSTVADDFNNANAMTLSWNWHVNNAEFNHYHQYGGIQTLAGFRYFNLEEHFNINTQDSDGDVSDYPIRASNNLYGGQIGARTYGSWKRFRFGVTGKAGIFGNDAVEHQTVFDNNNTIVLRDAQGRASACSFIGDTNAFVTYQVCQNWRLRAGYYALWATHVAIAPDQLDFSFNASSGTVVHNDGNLFVQGATFGVETAW